MKHEEIECYRKKLQEIIDRKKQENGMPARGTKGDLQQLAKKVGANIRTIYNPSPTRN